MSGKKTVHYKSKERMSRGDLATFLRSLADRVESGTVRLTSPNGEASLDLDESLELEVEYETKEKTGGPQHQLELEIQWGGKTSGVGLGS